MKHNDDDTHIDQFLREHGIDPETLVDDFQDHLQRAYAFGEQDEQAKDNFKWAIEDIEQYQTKRGKR